MIEMLTEGHHLLGAFAVALDLVGTFVFALSGAVAGVKHRFDLFGIMVLAFVTGNAGGMARDVLIGAGAARRTHQFAVPLDFNIGGARRLSLEPQDQRSGQAHPRSGCCRPCAVRSHRDAKSAGRRTEPGDGGAVGDVDGNRRRDDSRHIGQSNAVRSSIRSVRCRCAGGRSSSRYRGAAQPPAFRGNAHRFSLVPGASPDGDIQGLAPSHRQAFFARQVIKSEVIRDHEAEEKGRAPRSCGSRGLGIS